MKAQSSFEMLVTVATFLAFSMPIILAALAASQLKVEDFSLFHGRTLVQYLSDNVNDVYLQGNGAKRTILLDFPPNSKNLTVFNHTITLYLASSNGVYEISHPFFANVSDFNVSRTGIANINISMEEGQVKIR